MGRKSYGKSIVYEGRVVYHDKNIKLSTYRARIKITCSRCKKKIISDELFSRASDKVGTVKGIQFTFCRECIPFEVIEGETNHNSRKNHLAGKENKRKDVTEVKQHPEIDISQVISKLDMVKLETLNQTELLQVAKLVKVDELKKELKNKIRQEKINLAERLETFLNQKTASVNTRYIYKKAVNHFFSYLERNNIHPLSVCAYDVDLYLNFLNTEKYSSNSRRLYIAAVSSFYSSLKRWGDVDFNYFNGCLRPAKRVEKDIHVPNADDIELIKQGFCDDFNVTGRGAINKTRSARVMRILIEIMETTGIRVGALKTLKFHDDGSFKGFSKGKKIDGSVTIELYRRIKKSRIDFSRLKKTTIQDNFARKIKELFGSILYTPHGYRHYFATKLYTETNDIYLVSRALGHSSVVITENYLKSLKIF